MHKNLKSSHELEEVGWKIEWLEDERFSSALPLARGAQCFCILISAGVILGHESFAAHAAESMH